MTFLNKVRFGCWSVTALLVVTGCIYVWGPAVIGGTSQQSGATRIVVIVLGSVCAVVGVWLAITLPREIVQTVAPVASDVKEASQQVLAIASQVAAGAVQTATAISEAATTVDEVRQTSLLANQKSTALSDTAQEAERSADDGRHAVAEIVAGMNSIRDQIGQVAETVVKLSDQTKAAEQIAQTSNMLAEQSNLLSVNAAIEAAGAGEHGKGFGVVADEIRNLAAQSKQAVQQVRGILAEIQHATDAAVMATEQGSKTIDLNLHKAGDSSTAIENLADSVEMSAQSSLQIAASTQQQLIGMDQISQSMESINSASAQNASAARQMETEVARLEQAAAALARTVGGAGGARQRRDEGSPAGSAEPSAKSAGDDSPAGAAG